MIDLLRTRRSIRKYKRKPVDTKTVDVMKEALLRCPSSRGINPWTFVFVDDSALLSRLSETKEHGSAFLKEAALGVVVCGDETKSDVWVEDCSIASIVLQLVAHSLGLGSCWIQIRNRRHSKEKGAEEYVREVLGIPQNLKVEAIVSIGYPGEAREPVSADKLDYSRIHYNGLGEQP